MSTGDLFTGDIPQNILDDAMAKAVEIDELLQPYYVQLSNEDKAQVPKMADETAPFAEKTIEFMNNEPQFNPPYVDVAETEKDFSNHKRIRPLREKLEGLAGKVKDVGIAAGSDTFIQTLAYYNSAKRAAKMGVPGADDVVNELKQRFQRDSGAENGGGTPPGA